jgi:hypothetical protein
VIGAPIIAFEDSITASTKSDVPTTADLLSWFVDQLVPRM